MPRPRVYVETTIPSFYFDQRRAPFMVARRLWTRAWWNVALERYELVTSSVTLTELKRGPAARHAEWLTLLGQMPLVNIDDDVLRAAAEYLRHRVMPKRGEDAVHLAAASVHRCDYLVSWDVQHLANALKFQHIQKVNQSLGLRSPTIVTPLELIGRVA